MDYVVVVRYPTGFILGACLYGGWSSVLYAGAGLRLVYKLFLDILLLEGGSAC